MAQVTDVPDGEPGRDQRTQRDRAQDRALEHSEDTRQDSIRNGTLENREPGDIIVRLLDGVNPETRTLIGTGTFTATA